MKKIFLSLSVAISTVCFGQNIHVPLVATPVKNGLMGSTDKAISDSLQLYNTILDFLIDTGSSARAVSVEDDFGRSNTTDITGSTPAPTAIGQWFSGGTGTLGIVSNKLKVTSSSTTAPYVYTQGTGKIYDLSVIVADATHTAGSSYVILLSNFADLDNLLGFDLINGVVYQRVAASQTNLLVLSGYTVNNGDTIHLNVLDSAVYAYKNSTLLGSAVFSSASLTSHNIGLYFGSDSSTRLTRFLQVSASGTPSKWGVSHDATLTGLGTQSSPLSVASSAGLIVGTFSGTSKTNGASVSGNTITFGPADATNPGMVTNGTQTFAGTKTFSSLPVLSSLTAGSIPFAGTGGAITQNNSNLYWDNTNGRLGIGTNTFNSVAGVQINTNFNGPYGILLTNTNTGTNYASAGIGLGLDPSLAPYGSIGVLNGNFPIVGVLNPYAFVVGSQNGGGATAIVSSGGGTLGGYTLFSNGGSYLESMRLTPSRKLLIGDVVDNSTGLVQITSSTAQFALHYDPTHYANFTIGSGGKLTVSPSGVTTTFVAPTSSAATLNLPAGTFPSSPSSGDLGHTSGHLYFRDGSTTYDLLAASSEWTISGSNISNVSGTNVGIGTTTPTSTLDITGSLSANIVTVSANYTVLGTDYAVYVTNGATSVTITLPAASGDGGRIYHIARGSGSTGTITIATSGGNVEALSGSMGSTTTLAAIGSYGSKVIFQSTGTNYVRIGN